MNGYCLGSLVIDMETTDWFVEGAACDSFRSLLHDLEPVQLDIKKLTQKSHTYCKTMGIVYAHFRYSKENIFFRYDRFASDRGR